MRAHGSLLRTAICFALIGAVFTQPMLAQSSSAAAKSGNGGAPSFGAIQGTVVDSGGSSLALVQVVVIDSPRSSVRTNTGGGYRIDSVSAGLHMLRFRRVGLVPFTVPVTVRPDDITGVDAVLDAIPHTLATVTVQDTLGEVLRLPPGVAERMQAGKGTFITAAEIERRHAIRTSQVLQYVPGLEVTKDGGINSTRGVISINTVGCKYGLPIYIDGQRIADPHAGADTVHDSNLTDLVQPRDVALIEVYRGPSELPVTLSQDKCGGIFIWTKR